MEFWTQSKLYLMCHTQRKVTYEKGSIFNLPELKSFYANFTKRVKNAIDDHATQIKSRKKIPIISLVVLTITIPMIIYLAGKASQSLSQSSLLCTRQATLLNFKRKKIDKLLRQLLPSEALVRYITLFIFL